MSPDEEFTRRTSGFRRELLAHCYRMLGSVQDAEDLVQETYLRAWRGYDRFEGRSSLRTWLYRIATNACLTALGSRDRRVLPSGLGPPSDDPPAGPGPRLDTVTWLEPMPDALVMGQPDDPAAVAVRRDSTRLALVAALQHLPARQRAALLLRDVAGYSPAEVAEVLGTTTAAANSALQRARSQLARTAPSEDDPPRDPAVDERLLARYVAAFEQADVDALAGLLRADVELEMPPNAVWYQGRDAVLGFLVARPLCGGPRRLVPTAAAGRPAAATYVHDGDAFRAHNIQVIEPRGDGIAAVRAFLDPALFDVFGLPPVLEAPDRRSVRTGHGG